MKKIKTLLIILLLILLPVSSFAAPSDYWVDNNGTVHCYSLQSVLPITGITPAALTETNDTNVTLTLGGTPATALLQAVSLTLGWQSTLADGRIASASTWNAKESALTFQYSLSRAGNTINLLNDSASPGNSYYYGTNSSGTKGYFVLPGGGGMVYPGAGIALSTGSAWGTSITNNSANWNTAYGWGNWAHTTLAGYGITDAAPLAHKTTEDAINGLVFVNGAGTYSAKAIGTDVQAYNASLAAIAGGTWAGLTSITTLGTIATGVWYGTAIADSYIASSTHWNAAYSHKTTEDALSGLVFISGGSYSAKVIGTDVQAYNANLATIAGLTPVQNKIMIGNATPAWSVSTFTIPAIPTANKVLYGDSTNYVLSTPTVPLASAPTAGKVMIGDGTNWVASTPTYPNASSPTARKILVSDGTNWVASTETYAVPGTTGNVLTSDGTNWLSSAPGGGSQTPWTSNINAAGYTLYGNSTSGGNLTLRTTSNSTKGSIILPDATALESFVFGTPIGSSYPTLFDINTTMTTSGSPLVQAMVGIRGAMTGTAQESIPLDISIWHTPTVNIDAAYGLNSSVGVNCTSGKTTSFLNALYANVATQPGMAGTLTFGTGLYIDVPGTLAGTAGTMKATNSIGVYMENQGATGVTNAYGLYVNAVSGASTKNLAAWFGSDVAIGTKLVIGTDTPGADMLTIYGNMMLGGAAIRYIKGDTKDGSNNSFLYLLGAGTAQQIVAAIGTGATSIGALAACYGGSLSSTQALLYHNGTDGVISTGAGDLQLVPNSGYIRTGAYVATPGTITGYIYIKDSGGNLRKLAVTN